MPYSKNKSTEGTRFDVTPEEAPQIWKSYVAPLAIPFTIMFAISIIFALVILAIVAVWLFYMQNHENLSLYRTSSTFLVNEGGVTLRNRFFSKDDIHRLIIKNHMNEQYVFIPESSPGNAMRGLKLRQNLTNVSYRVDMESNGRAYTLAGGLDEPTAYAILRDVGKVMGFSAS